MNKPCLILERSSQNLRKIGDSKKTILEGVFAVFGKENRNQRIYEEQQYLPHLEYLKDDIKQGALLGELDHPQAFEVSLANVSHRITELWYDPQNRQVKGRIEILEGTPKGQIAKALYDAGVPLSISSRAAGSVMEDHRVQIQQIYTYDLVAKPGFAEAQLYNVSESEKVRLNDLAKALNESYNETETMNVAKKYGIIDDNVAIIELDEHVNATIRPEAKAINDKINIEYIQKKQEDMNISEKQTFKNDGNVVVNEGKFSNTDINELAKEIKAIKSYLENLRSIQESTINWQSDTAKAVNKLATYTDKIAKKGNKHYNITKKLCETVDYNADVTNNMQKWTSSVAEGLNDAIKKSELLEKWISDSNSKSNKIAEWVSDSNVKMNHLSEWTSSIANNLNASIDYAETMFGRSMSKGDGNNVMEYIDSIKEGKGDKKLRKKINESMNNTTLKSGKLNEGKAELKTLDKPESIKVSKDDKKTSIPSNVHFDPSTKTIVAKLSKSNFSKSTKPKELKTMDGDTKDNAPKVSSTEAAPKGLKAKKDFTKSETIKVTDKDEKKTNIKGEVKSKQNLKLDTKGDIKSIKESLDKKEDISKKRSSLDERLAAIAQSLAKEKALDESIKQEFPFTVMLSEADRKRFADMNAADKKMVNEQVSSLKAKDPVSVCRIWESVTNRATLTNEPLYITAAPEKYKKLFNEAPEYIQESIKARANFFNLETNYQIENFWETSGLSESVVKPQISNEVIASNINPTMITESVSDDFVRFVGNATKKYNS